ncbi:hypothetical protein [Ornithinibacillus halophilus]|uniref:YceG-like family protein n=1 Tax=Ornithinibacillus halophilus TaxID=930117 RepID=A0A1M5D2V3_9BACI|nr:hypothetical protein [Ornithinibacillus halophilus]SHF61187.1 YceG-like family protein [Ornithinibacillus halophilus]
MKQPIRAFSIGLFTAGMILLVVNYFSNGGVQDISEMPVEDVIEHLKEDGYRVLTESEYITLSVNQDKQLESTEEENTTKEEDTSTDDKEKENQEDSVEENGNDDQKQESDSNDKEDKDKDEEEETTISYTINIESGTASSGIAKELEENNIIDNADEFNRYLDTEGYSLRIQLGEFTVSNDMSFYELAEVLTNN